MLLSSTQSLVFIYVGVFFFFSSLYSIIFVFEKNEHRCRFVLVAASLPERTRNYLRLLHWSTCRLPDGAGGAAGCHGEPANHSGGTGSIDSSLPGEDPTHCKYPISQSAVSCYLASGVLAVQLVRSHSVHLHFQSLFFFFFNHFHPHFSVL